MRFWTLRAKVKRRILWGFGIMSAAVGLIGALLHEKLNNPVLIAVFGGLLVFAGLTGLTGLAARMRFGGFLAWVAGGISGFLGGLVGNQGGIRSAAMLGFEIPRHEFVATATAIALFVDAARVPVYVSNEHQQMAAVWFMASTCNRWRPHRYRARVERIATCLGTPLSAASIFRDLRTGSLHAAATAMTTIRGDSMNWVPRTSAPRSVILVRILVDWVFLSRRYSKACFSNRARSRALRQDGHSGTTCHGSLRGDCGDRLRLLALGRFPDPARLCTAVCRYRRRHHFDQDSDPTRAWFLGLKHAKRPIRCMGNAA